MLGGIGIRAAARLARDVFRDRVTLLGNQEAYFVELATAVQTLLVGTRTGRLALSSYRWSMRIVLAVGVALVLIGLAIALPLHTHHSAIVVGALFAILGLFVGWRWWAWSAGLRLLKAYADPTRTVSLTELPGRLKALAAEGEGLAEVSGPVVRDLRALAAWAGRIVDRGDKPKD